MEDNKKTSTKLIVSGIGLTASLVAVFAFLTGKVSIEDISKGFKYSLDRTQAAERIKSTDIFNAKLVLSLMTNNESVSSGSCNTALNRQPLWRALIDLGLVEVNIKQTTPGSAFSFAWFTCDMTFTEQGNKESSQWVKVNQPWGIGWEIPVANREFIAITGLTEGAPDKSPVKAEFSWKWTSNSIGQKLQVTDSQVYNSYAIFQKYDEGWRIVDKGISGRNVPAPFNYSRPHEQYQAVRIMNKTENIIQYSISLDKENTWQEITIQPQQWYFHYGQGISIKFDSNLDDSYQEKKYSVTASTVTGRLPDPGDGKVNYFTVNNNSLDLFYQ